MRSASGETLERCYAALLDGAGLSGDGHAAASYNWLMTRDWMLVVPRGSEFCGPVTVNSLGYAGTFFVRSEEEIEFVTTMGPLRVLAGMGVPWT